MKNIRVGRIFLIKSSKVKYRIKFVDYELGKIRCNTIFEDYGYSTDFDYLFKRCILPKFKTFKIWKM